MGDRFDNIERSPTIKLKKNLLEFSSSLLYMFITLITYLVILFCGFHFDGLCRSPLLNVVGAAASFLLISLSIAVGAIFGIVTGSFDVAKELWQMMPMAQLQVRVAIALTICVGFLIRLVVWKLKYWQNITMLNLTLVAIYSALFFIGGSWAIKHTMITLSYAQLLVLCAGLLPYCLSGFWRWNNWDE